MFKCNVCQRHVEFGETGSHAKLHQRSHGPLSVKCLCGEEFRNMEDLLSHKQSYRRSQTQEYHFTPVKE